MTNSILSNNINYTVELQTKISLHPSELNEKYHHNLLMNLKYLYENKCYKDIGYISNIISIKDIKTGYLINEDFSGNIHFNISFFCSLWKPTENQIITCSIKNISGKIIALATNGPINVYIPLDSKKFNSNNFIIDENKDILYAKLENNKGLPIIENSLVNVSIIKSIIINNKKIIMAIGFLESLPSEKDIETYNLLKQSFDKINVS